MKYWSRPFQVDAEQWTDPDNPPMGIHDVWQLSGGSWYGYLPSPIGDKLAALGQFIVKYPSGDVMALSEDEFNRRFQPRDDT